MTLSAPSTPIAARISSVITEGFVVVIARLRFAGESHVRVRFISSFEIIRRTLVTVNEQGVPNLDHQSIAR
jgi:hypothetical protein